MHTRMVESARHSSMDTEKPGCVGGVRRGGARRSVGAVRGVGWGVNDVH